MGIYDKIKRLCDSRHIAVTALEKELNFGRGSIGKMRKNQPRADRVQKIADYFGVPVDYLLSESDDIKQEGVQISVRPSWYTDPDAAELAQRLFDDPAYRVLFDAAADATPEDLQAAADILRRLKEARRK